MDLTREMAQSVKRELRARGWTIRRFSKLLKVSEPTLKRWLIGQGLLLKDWNRMLELLNVSPAEAVGRIDIRSRQQFEYSQEQEESFIKTPGLLAFFQQLLQGSTPTEIMKAFRLDRQSVSYYLKKLDDIELIRWGNGFEYQLKKFGEPKWKRNGPLSKTFRSRVLQELIINNRDSSKMRLAIYRMSLTDIQKIMDMIDAVYEFAKAAERRIQITNVSARSVGLGSVFSEYEPDFLYSIPNYKRKTLR